MGASIKRRESRKQKFSSLPPETIVQKEELVQRMTVDHQQAPDDTNALQTRNATESDGEQSSEAEPLKKNEEESTKHRFICFIGILHGHRVYQSSNSKCLREFTIYGYDPVHCRSFRRRETEPYSSQHREVDGEVERVRLFGVRRLQVCLRWFLITEANNISRMQSCIMQYHHSSFPDTEGTARKINVELTLVSVGPFGITC